jgi:hypothetical protein
MTKPTLAAAVWLVGCGGTPAAPGAPSVAVPAEAAAVAAFRAHAARRLQVAPSQLVDDSAYVTAPHTRGAAKATVMRPDGSSRIEVRGWVLPDGTVITPNQNLGRLFAEAGVWAAPPPPRDLASTLAGDLVWSYGAAAEVEPPSHGRTAPTLALGPDGAGTLVFFSRSESERPDPEAGDGGTGGGAAQFSFQDTVVLTPDHQATLTRTRFAETSPR